MGHYDDILEQKEDALNAHRAAVRRQAAVLSEQEQAKLNLPAVHGPADAAAKHDPVNQPAHYARWTMQPIEFIAINNLPFWLANVIKYSMRYDAKDGLQDLYKARSYLEMQIRKLEGEGRFWEKPVAEQQAHAK